LLIEVFQGALKVIQGLGSGFKPPLSGSIPVALEGFPGA
jgi:hypothetical protein